VSLPVFPDDTGNSLTRAISPTTFHLNRFRICVAPPGKDIERYRTIAAHLAHDMPKYMNAHTAGVQLGAITWNGQKTLRFRGVAKLRPFSVPIYYPPFIPVPIVMPVPEQLRDWAIPDIHTDWVGIQPGSETATGFTAQTLKRNFLDPSDHIIKSAALAALLAAEARTWWNPIVSWGERKLEEIVSAYVIWVNQHHFLAGRRSFRFLPAKVLGGYPKDDERWVFETAAMERFSLLPYVASQLAMGKAEDIVRPVWVEMVQQFCNQNHLKVIPDTGLSSHWSRRGNVSYLQKPYPGYTAMVNSTHGRTLAQHHLKIHP
jgi:hypothetical protein